MIVVEKRMYEATSTLPDVGNKKPNYRWGNEYHLLKTLETFQKNNKSPYPLIYQVSNESYQDTSKNEVEILRLILVIATRTTDTSLLNENRWAMAYDNILFPMVQNMEQMFKKSGIFRWDGKYKLSTFPNYGNGKENFTIDKWDAVQIETKIIINNNCLNKIFYDTN